MQSPHDKSAYLSASFVTNCACRSLDFLKIRLASRFLLYLQRKLTQGVGISRAPPGQLVIVCQVIYQGKFTQGVGISKDNLVRLGNSLLSVKLFTKETDRRHIFEPNETEGHSNELSIFFPPAIFFI